MRDPSSKESFFIVFNIMPHLCPQLKQNLEVIKTLKSELDLELSKIEKLFKDLKNSNPSTSLRAFEHKAERKDLMNKIKEIKNKIDSSINELNSRQLENPRFALKQTWRNIYKNWFDKEIDISSIEIPEDYDPEKHFGLIIPGNLTMNEIAIVMRKKFNVYLYKEDLDTEVNKNDRPTDKTYAILFKNNIEADEDLKNISANQLAEQGIKGITLKERLLMEIFYFEKTGEHLDANNVTLCSGSRDSVDYVPRVNWGSVGSKLYVHWYGPDDSDSNLRSRLAVSGS
jgi:hypothetical protein